MGKSTNTPTERKPDANKSTVSGGGFSATNAISNVSMVEGAIDSVKPFPSWKGPPSDKSHMGSGDPFGGGVSLIQPNSGIKLSPGAPDFEPAGPSSTALVHKPSQLSILNRYSDVDGPVIVESAAEANGKTPQQPIGTRTSSYSPPKKVFFTTDMGPDVPFLGGHYMKVDRVSAPEFQNGMSALFDDFGWGAKLIGQKAPHSNSAKKFLSLFLCFNDIRDAATAEDEVSLVQASWTVTYISHQEYAAAGAGTTLGTTDQTSFHDGQVIFVAAFEGAMSEIDNAGVKDAVYLLAVSFGDVLAFVDAAQPNSPGWEFRAEFYKISGAKAALAAVPATKPHFFGNWSITTKPMSDAASMQIVACVPAVSVTPPALPGAPGNLYCSPTGRTAWSVGPDGKYIIEPPAKQVPKCYGSGAVERDEVTPHRERYYSEPSPHTPAEYTNSNTPRSGSWAGPTMISSSRMQFSADGEPQSVSIFRINAGQDVRTTIMLRNLPNKWTIHDLRRILEETCKGKYDFVYLRIDFSYNTNVGYAFVNFIDASHIVDFYQTWVGKEWQPGSHPRKIAQISYATIQGIDCLIEKFRNSAVMDEFPDYRPKLIYTEESAPDKSLISTERPFPSPNNMSKKQRSHDNAGQIGLYAPRTGQRGGDRHHRSQYDRGTTAQIQEDTYYNQASPGSSGYGFNDFHYVTGPPRLPMAPHGPGFHPMFYPNPAFNPAAMFEGMNFLPEHFHGAYPNGMVFPGNGPYGGSGPLTPVRQNGFGMGPNNSVPRARPNSKARNQGGSKTIGYAARNNGGPVQGYNGGFPGWSWPGFNGPNGSMNASVPRTHSNQREDETGRNGAAGSAHRAGSPGNNGKGRNLSVQEKF